MHPFDHHNQPSKDDSNMFEMTENSDANQFAAESTARPAAAGKPAGLGNDAQAIEERIAALTGQLADLTRQLEALKVGNRETEQPDPFASDVAQAADGVDPFASAECASTALRPGREELSEVFSKIKNSFDDEEVLLDESSATPLGTQSGDSEADEELVEPEVAVSMSPATPREPESVAEVLARMKASGQLESDLELNSEPNDSTDPDSAPSEELSTAAAAPLSANAPVNEPNVVSGQTDAGGGEAEEDVQSYMSQLLTRLNGGSAPDADSGVGKSAKSSVQVEQAVPQPEPVETNQSMLEPDEFVPSQVAPEKNANLAAMRELALETTRSAVSSSIERRRKAKIMISFSASLASFSAAGFTGMLSSRFGDNASLTAVALTIIGFSLGLMMVKALMDKPGKK